MNETARSARSPLTRDLDQEIAGGVDPAFRAVLDVMGHFAKSRLCVVFTGPTGVGKSRLARELHRLSGRRGKFVTIDCPAIQPTLFESVVFGHVRGAFTGADRTTRGRVDTAAGGTLFLEEVGDLSEENQTRLLSFLGSMRYSRVGDEEEHPADVRIVAATNRELANQLRSDFRRRIAEVEIDVPPLDERPDDIPALAEFEVRRWAEVEGWRARPLSDEATDLLLGRPWPDNVAGLSTAVHKALLAAHQEGAPALLARHFGEAPPPVVASLDGKLRAFERRVLARALRSTDDDVTRAAQALGIPRQRLHRRIRELGVERPG